MTPSERRQDLAQRLLAIAAARIEEQGLSGLKARDLAQEAGCAVGGIYTVFKDLDDLVLQVNGQTFSSLGSAVNKAVHAAKDGPPVGRLIAMANAYYDFAKAHRNRWQALFDTQFSQGDELPEWYRAEVSSLFAIIAEPVTTLRPDLNEHQVGLLVRGLFASVHGIVLLSVQKRISAVPDADVSWVMESMLRAATR
ncbi:MAG: TetR/AcrR family transcriptional regulator [Pseudomonadota bacterium]